MRIARFSVNGHDSHGLIEGDRVLRIDRSPYEAFNRTGETFALGEVKLLPPTIPPVFYSAGLNYQNHCDWGNEVYAKKYNRHWTVTNPPEPQYRSVNAIIGTGDNIELPEDAEDVQYESELCAVIGRKAKHVSEKEALDYVLGYTLCNDVSVRVWQFADKSLWRSKNSDTFKPLGPCIATGLDPQNIEITTRVNGKVDHQYNTREMACTVAQYIAVMSRYVSLLPGDILMMGSNGRSGNFGPGDVVEIEAEGIGVLRNPVVRV